MKSALAFVGTHHGNEVDKWAGAHIAPVDAMAVRGAVISQCALHLECKIVEHYTMAEDKFDKELGEKWYANKDWHTCYTGIITAAYVEK